MASRSSSTTFTMASFIRCNSSLARRRSACTTRSSISSLSVICACKCLVDALSALSSDCVSWSSQLVFSYSRSMFALSISACSARFLNSSTWFRLFGCGRLWLMLCEEFWTKDPNHPRPCLLGFGWGRTRFSSLGVSTGFLTLRITWPAASYSWSSSSSSSSSSNSSFCDTFRFLDFFFRFVGSGLVVRLALILSSSLLSAKCAMNLPTVMATTITAAAFPDTRLVNLGSNAARLDAMAAVGRETEDIGPVGSVFELPKLSVTRRGAFFVFFLLLLEPNPKKDANGGFLVSEGAGRGVTGSYTVSSFWTFSFFGASGALEGSGTGSESGAVGSNSSACAKLLVDEEGGARSSRNSSLSSIQSSKLP
mmetsp:Transcript_15723/g.29746  ORF Transcript_15723/g.29746 Transcript_15723/m.29746 type:complete len:366 (-) Transcript_15723:496-1593(-)